MGKQFEVGKNYIATKMETYLKENKPVREAHFYVEEICGENRHGVCGSLLYEEGAMKEETIWSVEPLLLKFNTHDEFLITEDCDGQEWIVHVEEMEATNEEKEVGFEVGKHYLCNYLRDFDKIHEEEDVILTPTEIGEVSITAIVECPVTHTWVECILDLYGEKGKGEFVWITREEDTDDMCDELICESLPMSEERYQRLVKPFVAN